jgi:hypothetical protein
MMMASFVRVTRGRKKLETGLQQLSRVIINEKKTIEKLFGLPIILLNQIMFYETFDQFGKVNDSHDSLKIAGYCIHSGCTLSVFWVH